MVVVVVGYYHGIDGGYIFNLAGDVCVALWAEPAEGAAALAEYGVKEDAKAPGKFNKVASMAEPCCAEGGGFAGGEKGGFPDCDGWRCCVRTVAGA